MFLVLQTDIFKKMKICEKAGRKKNVILLENVVLQELVCVYFEK